MSSFLGGSLSVLLCSYEVSYICNHIFCMFQVHTEKIQKEAERDLLSLICETYTVSNKRLHG